MPEPQGSTLKQHDSSDQKIIELQYIELIVGFHCNFSISVGKKPGSPITTFGDDDLNCLQLRHSGRLLAGIKIQ